jgi:hypothetical protein
VTAFKMGRGIGGHHSARFNSCEWYTPPEIVHALGEFDLDPCSPAGYHQFWTAQKHFTEKEDGFVQKWKGRVWLNPPYGPDTWKWLWKLYEHGNGIALIFARTETKGFFRCVWNKADAIFFFYGRLSFINSNGDRSTHNSGGPSCLVAYGENNVYALKESGLKGKLVYLSPGM